MSGIKSSYEIALEKMKSMDIEETVTLSEEQKGQIAEIRNMFKAKIAEKKILLKDAPELPAEISFLEREQERKIQDIYGKGSKK